MKIVNLTQHRATPEQLAQGVVDLSDEDQAYVRRLLTFDKLPTQEYMEYRALDLTELATAQGATHALIGGAPFFMSTLERALKVECITPVYAFSVRESKEAMLADGSVSKISVFKHIGFVEIKDAV